MERMIKKCPLCNKEVEYKHIISYKKAIKNNSICHKCAAIKRCENPDVIEHLKKISSLSKGEKNGMYKKTVYELWVEKYGEDIAEEKYVTWLKKLKEISKAGKENPMYGVKIYDIWVEKYGEEVANTKLREFKNKQSINSTGKNNPMYGKPSPMGSGNGWSGWYKGWYFRSLRELTYMIKIIERFKLNWCSGESKKYKIEYVDYKGNIKNYFPDFIIYNKYMVECKPKRLWNSDVVKRKKIAGLKFCLENSLTYKIVDIGVLSNEEIRSLHDKQLIKFLPRYEKKYSELYVTHKKTNI